LAGPLEAWLAGIVGSQRLNNCRSTSFIGWLS
jgi:hypothetical protein